ncbi:MAG: anaerobic magnesium-protoporphyrin monomethyl ester cyclase [Gammaproteobacteria bacterium]|jgi:anaerobic magnesium-protoporphyrin IX monomethyl ester cyclase|nr:anaerobic magnesium-protoporphyrin monomethyl ester cyclase [Gammaproteobacteria bacterium]
MISILVCHSYFLRFDPKQAERGKPYPPLATLQVAAMLRQAGHQVALFDAMLADGLEEYEAKLEATRPQVVLLYEDNFNFLSKMCLGKMREAACRMIGRARHAGARVIASGPDVSDSPETYLRAGADITLKGEGLGALMELLSRLSAKLNAPAGELIQGVSGAATGGGDILVKVNGVGSHPPTPGGSNSASIPQTEMAAWDLVDMDRYRAVWMRSHGYFSLNMAASRGCSFRCTWCAKPIWGNQYLQRSAASVAAEMDYLRRTFNPGHIWFADDIFGFRVDWVNEFAAAVSANGGGIPFTIQTRADLLSERMATALAAAGCKEAWLGAESGSQHILDAMNKGTTVAEIITARARLQATGIRVGFFIQLGYLDEQLPDILATRQLLETARPDDVGVSVSYPLPGTKFYELVKVQLGGKTHWQDSDDLAMMFRGTYTSEFYRAIRDLIHEQVSLQIREKDVPANEKSPARRALDRSWHKLLGRESLYRSQADVTLKEVTAYEARLGASTGTVGRRSVD